MCVLVPLLYNGLLCIKEVKTKQALAAGNFRAAIFFLNQNYSPKSEWKRVTQSELLFSFTSFPSLAILSSILSFLSILIGFRLLQVKHCLLVIHPCPPRSEGLAFLTPQSHSRLPSLHVHVGFGGNKLLDHLNTPCWKHSCSTKPNPEILRAFWFRHKSEYGCCLLVNCRNFKASKT